MPADSTKPVHFPIEEFARPGRVELRLVEGPGAPRSFEIKDARVSFGRSAAADERVDSPSMSKRHFELRMSEQGVEVHDLGSRNGLWLGEARVLGGLLLRPGQEALGWEVGDILLDINDYELPNTEAFADAYPTLTDSQKFELTLIRDGRELVLRYRVK